MEDLVINVAWAALVTAVTVGADWLAGTLITSARAIRAIQGEVDGDRSADDKLRQIKTHVSSVKRTRAQTRAWGSDVVAVAMSLDIAALGIALHKPGMFPFFSRWNTQATDRSLLVWALLLLLSFVLLIASLVLRNLHGDKIGAVEDDRLASLFTKGWWSQNSWLIINNALGFTALVVGFGVLTNTL